MKNLIYISILSVFFIVGCEDEDKNDEYFSQPNLKEAQLLGSWEMFKMEGPLGSNGADDELSLYFYKLKNEPLHFNPNKAELIRDGSIYANSTTGWIRFDDNCYYEVESETCELCPLNLRTSSGGRLTTLARWPWDNSTFSDNINLNKQFRINASLDTLIIIDPGAYNQEMHFYKTSDSTPYDDDGY